MLRTMLLLLLLSGSAFAQDDLLTILDNENQSDTKEPVTATFKTTRIVTGQSVELNHGGVLNFVTADCTSCLD
jgi:hypothetical protein